MEQNKKSLDTRDEEQHTDLIIDGEIDLRIGNEIELIKMSPEERYKYLNMTEEDIRRSEEAYQMFIEALKQNPNNRL